MSIKKIVTFFILLVANVVVVNAGYSLWSSPKDTPALESLKGCVVYKLYIGLRKSAIRRQSYSVQGRVNGILYNDNDPIVMICGETVGKGDTINGAQIVDIGRNAVEFEKNGHRWSQLVNEEPSGFWSDDN